MVANNYRFRSINFPPALGPSIILQGQDNIAMFVIPDGATDLNVASVEIELLGPSQIYATWSSTINLAQGMGIVPPVSFTYALAYDSTLFPGSQRKLEWGDTNPTWISCSASSATDVLTEGTYTIYFRILTASVEGGATAIFDPEGCLTVFSIPIPGI